MAHNSNDRETHDIDEPETVDIVDDPSFDHDSDHDSDHDDGHGEPSKSKKGKYIMYGGIAVLVGVLGVTAMQMFGGSEAPAPVTQEKEVPVTPQNVETTTPQQASVPTVPQNSTPTPETATPVNQGVSVLPAQNGEQVLPDLNQNIDNGNPNKVKGITPEDSATTTAPDLNSGSATSPTVSGTTPATTAQPETNVPVPQSATPNEAQAPSVPVQDNTAKADVPAFGADQDSGIAPIAPIGGNTSAPVNTSTPPLSAEASDDLNDSIKLLIKKMDGLSDSMDNLSDAVKDTNKRVDNTDKKVDELTKRVEKLEGKLSGSTVSTPAAAVVKKAPVMKKKRSQSYSNSVELSNTSSKRVSHVKRSYTPKRTTEASSRLGGGYTLQSVVTDRAWIKRTDGTMATYGIGDRMPNGKVVGSIDPDNGVFDTNGKLIIK